MVKGVSDLKSSLKSLAQRVAVRVLLTWERLESGVALDPLSRRDRQYPYDAYKEVRSKDPVHRMRVINGWALTRYEDVDTVLRDHRRFSNGGRSFTGLGPETLLDLDPPDHTRLRSLVSKAFTPRSVASLTPRIEQVIEELLDEIGKRERFDLIEDFAFPLPVIVIAEMLGVPPEDRAQFKVWSNDIAITVEPIIPDDRAIRLEKSTFELFEYLEAIITAREKSPQDDMISALIAARDNEDRLSHDELLGTLVLLLVAGNETTRNLIGNGMLALLKNPDQLQLLRESPELIDDAIHELLRYDSPVQLDGRLVTEDVEIGGKRLRANQRVISFIGAANRDPDAFANPDALDITRQRKSNLSFGRGIHYCLGAPLALLEGKKAILALLERFPSMRLVSEPTYMDQLVLRGVGELLVEVS